MRRWRLFSPRDKRTGDESKAIQLDAVRTGRSGTRREEMRLRFRCNVGEKRWEATVFVSNIINSWHSRVFPHFELGHQERDGPHGVWEVTSNQRGIIYSGDAYEFAQALVATEQEGQTNLRIQLRLLPHSRHPDSYTGTWNIEGVGAAVAWLERQCKWKRETLEQVPAARPVPSSAGKWEVFVNTDESKDERRIGVNLRSSSYDPAREDQQAWLFVRCTLGWEVQYYIDERQESRRVQTSNWEVYIAWGQRVASGGSVEVMTQYGTGPMVIEDWSLSTNGESTFASQERGRGPRRFSRGRLSRRSPEDQMRVINKLQETNRFAAGVVTVDGDVLTATWDVAGLTEALQLLAVARNAIPAPWDQPT